MGESKNRRKRRKLEKKKLKLKKKELKLMRVERELEANECKRDAGNTFVIDPADLVIFETPEGMRLRKDHQVIVLDEKNPLVHPRRQLLEHIREEFDGFGVIAVDERGIVVKPNLISSYMLLGVQRCMENDPENPFMDGFSKWLICDPCLSRCAGPKCVDQVARWQPLYRFYESEGLSAPDFAQIPVDYEDVDDVDSILRKRIEPMVGLGNSYADEFMEFSKTFVDKVDTYFRRLGPEEWAVMWSLHSFHDAVLFPLLLVTGKCSTQEYANGLMAAHGLLTTAFGDVDVEAHAQQVRGFREDAQIVLGFLDHARSPWTKEIFKGEDNTREFKATLRYDLATTEHNKELEHSVLKNVAGFLNSQGGTIFVGVGDGGEIDGIELDGFESNDKWSLHLVTRIGQQIGKRFLAMCLIEFDVLHGKAVCRISVQPSSEPAFLDERPVKAKGKKDVFFIRGGPSAHKLNPEETAKYIAQRFPTSPTPLLES